MSAEDPLAGSSKSTGEPLLRVVRGEPTDEELAALAAVITAMASQQAPEPPPQPRSLWADRSSLQRRPHHPGPGAWRASAHRF
ncbi:acyl-CoA carboxylase subunit epsilon [Allokutzneria sp. A3M-2-11 16]|uniref:acyl-CoA carboxylase subunit epsilon n=1 Tax=Allokutzneria sp. A3M-2-11 16 TaxID=2962043 RepID=UPI0020B6A2FB|nr:acyl-CoA carboxylase subunit epsilon [Allokutzneria sp. A3M-2-11 16]MCP3800447.1 acyl-CoA carboxylase subunit epsilon [Allokutzneria sp. A3M-2-11 16]